MILKIRKFFFISVTALFSSVQYTYALYSFENPSDVFSLQEYAKQLPEAIEGNITLIHPEWVLATTNTGAPSKIYLGGKSYEVSRWETHPTDRSCPVRLGRLSAPIKEIAPIPCSCFPRDDLVQRLIAEVTKHGMHLVTVVPGNGTCGRKAGYISMAPTPESKLIETQRKYAIKYFEDLCLGYYNKPPKPVVVEHSERASLFLVLGNSKTKCYGETNPDTQDFIFVGLMIGNQAYYFSANENIRNWIYQKVYAPLCLEDKVREELCELISEKAFAPGANFSQIDSEITEYLGSFRDNKTALLGLGYETSKYIEGISGATHIALAYQAPIMHMLFNDVPTTPLPTAYTYYYTSLYYSPYYGWYPVHYPVTVPMPQQAPKDDLSPSAHIYCVKGENYGYLKIPTFLGISPTDLNKTAYDKVRVEECIHYINTASPNVLILDLRGNGGGAAANAEHLQRCLLGASYMSYFSLNQEDYDALSDSLGLPKNYRDMQSMDYLSLSSFIQGKMPRSPKHKALYPGTRFFVLVDEKTGSAGEMTAAILKHLGGALLVGEKTAGNCLGSIQEAISYGFSVQMPFAGTITPEGKSIDIHGIAPDIGVPKGHDVLQHILWSQDTRNQRWEDKGIGPNIGFGKPASVISDCILIDSEWALVQQNRWNIGDSINIEGVPYTIDKVGTITCPLAGTLFSPPTSFCGNQSVIKMTLLHLSTPAFPASIMPRCRLKIGIGRLISNEDGFNTVLVNYEKQLCGMNNQLFTQEANTFVDNILIQEALTQ